MERRNKAALYLLENYVLRNYPEEKDWEFKYSYDPPYQLLFIYNAFMVIPYSWAYNGDFCIYELKQPGNLKLVEHHFQEYLPRK